VDESYFQLLNAGPAGFASRRLLPADAVIEALRLPGLALRRAGPGWALEPAPETPSADNVRALLQAWRRAEAIWLEYRPGDAAAADIELSTSAGDIAFTLRRQDNELVLYRADLGLEYHLPGQAVETLLKLPLIPPLDDA